MLCAILRIGSGRSMPFLERDSRTSSQAAHWVSPLAMALPHNLRVEACMRCSQSALLGVGTRASGEIGSETPVAGAAEMTGVSPAERTGVRDAGTTAQTRGIEARHAHPFVVAGPPPTPPVFLRVRGTRMRRGARTPARGRKQPTVVPKKGAGARTKGDLPVHRTSPAKTAPGHEVVVSIVVRGTTGHRSARRRSLASQTVRRSVLPQLLPDSREKRTVAEMGFSVRAAPAPPPTVSEW